MKHAARRFDPAVIIETVIETLLSEGADLMVVTLDEFKQRMTQTIRSMAQQSNAIAARSHCGTASPRGAAA